MAYLKLLFWLLATCCSRLNSVAAASVPASLVGTNINDTSTSAINLPKGFDSQATPINPLLYPFATADMPPPAAWQPMPGYNTTHTQHSLEFAAVLQDRILTAATAPTLSSPAQAAIPEAGEAESNVGPVLESIVYGTWKPEQIPVQPQQMFDLASSDSLEENVANDRIDDRLMAILSGQHDLTEQYDFPESRHSIPVSSTERKDDGVYAKIPITKKYGRIKIRTQQENQNHSEIKAGLAVISVNISDPHLLAMAKQINHSAEITTAAAADKPVETTHSTWMPMASTTTAPSTENGSDESTIVAIIQGTTVVPRNWPTDFEHTTMTRGSTPPSHANYNIKSDNTDGPPQALSGGFNIPESLLPQMPFNITKMGVPYEHQNSSEEPSICVPLTVREESLANTPGSAPEMVNVERVYCFPLPSAEEKNLLMYGNDTDTDIGNGSTTPMHGTEEAKVNVLSDFEEEPQLPSAAPIFGHIDGRGLFTYTLVCLTVLRYHHPT